MNNFKASFEDVADWCEKHLEAQRGREIGMTFGAMLRAYGRLATLPSRLHGEQRAAKERQLNAKAEELLARLAARMAVPPPASRTAAVFHYDGGDRQRRTVDPASMSFINIIYDVGPVRKLPPAEGGAR